MTQFGIYPADTEDTALLPVRGQMFVIVEADSSDQAVHMAIESGAMRPGELSVIDLTDAELFGTEMATNVRKKEKPPRGKPTS